MKRMRKLFFIIPTVLLIFAIPAYAAGEGETDKYWRDFLENLPDGVEFSSEDDVISAVGIDALLSLVFSAFSDNIGGAVSFLALLLGIAFLMALAECAAPSENPAFSRHISAGISTVSSLLIFSRIAPICLSVKEGIINLSLFFSLLVPVFTAVLSAGGSVNSATTQALNMNITYGIIVFVAERVLLPLVFLMFALALVGNMDSGAISTLSKKIRGFFTWAISIGGAVITGAVAMQSVIANAKDTAYIRAIKYASSGMIPIVGTTVSSALGNLIGGLSFVKSAIGVGSVVAILAIVLSPMVNLLLYRFSFSLSISLLEYMGAHGGARSFTSFRSAIDCLISVYAVVSVVSVLEIIVFMKSGVMAFG